MKIKNYYSKYFSSINEGLNNTIYFKKSKSLKPNIFFNDIKNKLIKIRSNKNKIFFFGNGASASFANHMALDFSKNGEILSRSLSDNALLSALSNDYSYEEAMTEFLKIEKVEENDLVITISSSGNSSNILNVLNFCKKNKITSLALSGLKRNNKSISLADYSLYVPMRTYGIVECIHQIFLHLFLDESMDISEWNMDYHQNMNSKEFKL
tara:strand:+ start:217 stop:846 length:630 start_codon:yes stop_codon:yes gene_type:complete